MALQMKSDRGLQQMPAVSTSSPSAEHTSIRSIHSAIDYRRWDSVGNDDDENGGKALNQRIAPAHPVPADRPSLPTPLDADDALQWLRSHGPTEEEQIALAEIEERLSAPGVCIDQLFLDPAASAAAGPNAAVHINADHVLSRAGQAVLAVCDTAREQPSLIRLGVRHSLWCRSVDEGTAASASGGGGAAAALRCVLAWALLESCAAESAVRLRQRLTSDEAVLRAWVESAVVPAFLRCTREPCTHGDYLREMVCSAGRAMHPLPPQPLEPRVPLVARPPESATLVRQAASNTFQKFLRSLHHLRDEGVPNETYAGANARPTLFVVGH